MHSSPEYRMATLQLRIRQALAMIQTGYGDGRSACLCRSQIFEQAFPCRLGFWSKGIAHCNATDANGLRQELSSVRPPPPDWLVEAVLAHRKEPDRPPEL